MNIPGDPSRGPGGCYEFLIHWKSTRICQQCSLGSAVSGWEGFCWLQWS